MARARENPRGTGLVGEPARFDDDCRRCYGRGSEGVVGLAEQFG